MSADKFVIYVNSVKKNERFGDFIRWVRNKRNLNLRQLSKIIDVTVDKIRNFEGGNEEPPKLIKEKIIKLNESF
jgi:transcriptional regulator with XRE-family HTH domain